MENKPLAERMRPKSLEDYIGQQHLVGPGKVLRKMIDSGVVSSFILWGPPGVGKTTLAMIIAEQLKRPFYVLSAVSSGVKDVREVIQKAEGQRFFNTPNPILFIDEIHRFSKAQQDSLLAAVEKGKPFFRGDFSAFIALPGVRVKVSREKRSRGLDRPCRDQGLLFE